MVNADFRRVRAKVSSMSEDDCVGALRSCKELEARIIKRLASFKGEFVEDITNQPKELLE